ncbi:MAG: TIGR03905 family TSCPD domain-containing protein [Firmicutes bacterium]|nr:TIGR03905 family TSCPD domain-containing protein [Bacillota bacterium]
MAKYEYRPQGVCSQLIEFEIIDNKVHNVKYTGGCNGNTQGVARLVEGMDRDEAVKRLRGIDCRGRGTSCPDQLAQALEAAD